MSDNSKDITIARQAHALGLAVGLIETLFATVPELEYKRKGVEGLIKLLRDEVSMILCPPLIVAKDFDSALKEKLDRMGL